MKDQWTCNIVRSLVIIFLWDTLDTREFMHYVYSKQQMSDSSWEFLKIDYEQIKKAQNNSYGQKIAWNLPIYVLK